MVVSETRTFISPESLQEPIRVVGMFPGQGSQEHGMGRQVAATFPEAREIFNTADHVLGYPLSEICFSDNDPRLHQTQFTQPAIVTHSIATLRVLERRAPELLPQLYVGHSLGEISAAVAAGALEFEDAILLASKRAEFMQEAGLRNRTQAGEDGGMGYIVNASFDEVTSQVDNQTVFIANRNLPTQTIISGYKGSVRDVLEHFNYLKEHGRDKIRAGELLVSEAAHSPLMEYARQRLAEFLSSNLIQMPDVPLLLNGSNDIAKSVAEIRENFSRQLVKGVDWVTISQNLRALGATQFIEFGPKSVLTGLMTKSKSEESDEEIISLNKLSKIRDIIE